MDDAHHIGAGRWKIPAGSLVIDGVMVLVLAYSAGQWTKAVEALDQRIAVVEQRNITPEAARRISVLEEQMRHTDAERDEMMAQLTRIEQKIDQHTVAHNGK